MDKATGDAIAQAPKCQRCQGSTKLRRNIVVNGTSQFFWWCYRCNRMTPPGTFVKHDDVISITREYGKTPDDIHVLNNYAAGRKCVVCGKQGVELHHFAPQAWRDRFGDNWDKWPTADLCLSCHALWHKIVTPGLTK